jgi:hypothetical protein
MKHVVWRRSDPRHDINKRATIVILRPALSGLGWTAGIGYVETHQGYSVSTSFEDHGLIGEGDAWDDSWAWAFAPER